MGKAVTSAVLDAMLVCGEGDRVCVCSAEATSYAQATSTYMLAMATVTPGTDFTKAAGAVSGRKNTLAAKNGTSITNTGVATHVAIANSGDSTLRRVTTCVSQTLTAGGTVDIGTSTHEIQAPT